MIELERLLGIRGDGDRGDEHVRWTVYRVAAVRAEEPTVFGSLAAALADEPDRALAASVALLVLEQGLAPERLRAIERATGGSDVVRRRMHEIEVLERLRPPTATGATRALEVRRAGSKRNRASAARASRFSSSSRQRGASAGPRHGEKTLAAAAAGES